VQPPKRKEKPRKHFKMKNLRMEKTHDEKPSFGEKENQASEKSCCTVVEILVA
jgi:hypothetical protein